MNSKLTNLGFLGFFGVVGLAGLGGDETLFALFALFALFGLFRFGASRSKEPLSVREVADYLQERHSHCDQPLLDHVQPELNQFYQAHNAVASKIAAYQQENGSLVDPSGDDVYLCSNRSVTIIIRPGIVIIIVH